MSWQAEVNEINQRRELARQLGGSERVQRQHDEGKYTVRERIGRLVDADSFHEYGGIAGAATYEDHKLVNFLPAPYIMGTAKLNGRSICIGGEDFTIKGGSAPMELRRIKGGLGGFVEDMALEYKLPLVLLIDGSGANVSTVKSMGHTHLPSSADWSRPIELLSEVPVVGAVLGSAAGGPAARAMLTHWVCMVSGSSHIFTAGPPVAKRALGEDLSKEELGGAEIQVRESGVVHDFVDSEDEAFEQIRRLLSFLPSSVYEEPPRSSTKDSPFRREEELCEIVPRRRGRAYNMRRVLELVFDNDCPMLEIQREFGRCVITALARLNGYPVAVIAHNPQVNGGAIDANGAEKLSHFLEFADTFHLPIVNFVDVPGFMIGSKAEREATIRKGMRAFYIGNQCAVPQVAIIVRRCYGMAGSFRPSKLNLRVAWPSAEWGSIPIEGGVDAAYRREIAAAPDPSHRRREIEDELRLLRSPFPTAERFGVEDMIDPRSTREFLCQWIGLAWRAIPDQLGKRFRSGVRP